MTRFALVLVAVSQLGCGSSLTEDLLRAQAQYKAARYERALVWLEDVGYREVHLDEASRLRYFYLRGMTLFRLNRPQDARHYLAIAREEAKTAPVVMPETWRRNMDRSLRLLSDQLIKPRF